MTTWNEYQSNWRRANPDRVRRYKKANRDARRTHALQVLGGECVVCGSDFHLHVDHIDPSTKEMTSQQMYTTSFERLNAELAK